MLEKEQNIGEIIERILHGSPSAEEISQFEEWLNIDPQNKKIFETLQGIKFKFPQNINEIKSNAFNKIQLGINSEVLLKKYKIWRYTAVASIAVIIAFSFVQFFSKPQKSSNIAYIETKVPYGQNSKLILSDSTVVYLNSGSSIKYPVQFTQDTRNVILEGEAYFEVRKDAEHPFIVKAGDINVKVLGTHFNIRNFKDENIIETSLLEGSVEVAASGNNGLILKPDQQAVYNKESKQISRQTIDSEMAVIWKDGKFYFAREKFSEVAKTLGRYYNVKIFIESKKLGDTKLSGLFDNNRSVYQILNIMKAYCKFNYQVRNDSIFIEDTLN